MDNKTIKRKKEIEIELEKINNNLHDTIVGIHKYLIAFSDIYNKIFIGEKSVLEIIQDDFSGWISTPNDFNNKHNILFGTVNNYIEYSIDDDYVYYNLVIKLKDTYTHELFFIKFTELSDVITNHKEFINNLIRLNDIKKGYGSFYNFFKFNISPYGWISLSRYCDDDEWIEQFNQLSEEIELEEEYVDGRAFFRPMVLKTLN